jgi:hypothetical protein
MRKLILIIFSLLLFSCSELIDEPRNLVAKDKMSQVIADFALNEQLGAVVPNINLDNATRYTLKKYQIKGDDFSKSYTYYIATGEMEKILIDAQEIIINIDPAAKLYIEKRIKENKNVPAFAR